MHLFAIVIIAIFSIIGFVLLVMKIYESLESQKKKILPRNLLEFALNNFHNKPEWCATSNLAIAKILADYYMENLICYDDKPMPRAVLEEAFFNIVIFIKRQPQHINKILEIYLNSFLGGYMVHVLIKQPDLIHLPNEEVAMLISINVVEYFKKHDCHCELKFVERIVLSVLMITKDSLQVHMGQCA